MFEWALLAPACRKFATTTTTTLRISYIVSLRELRPKTGTGGSTPKRGESIGGINQARTDSEKGGKGNNNNNRSLLLLAVPYSKSTCLPSFSFMEYRIRLSSLKKKSKYN